MTSLVLAIALIGQHADGEYRFRASWPNEVGCLAAPIPASPVKLGQRDDPYSFLTWINGTRRIYGLRPLVYDRELEHWAVANNRAQRAMSRAGHYVLAPAAGQAAACITGPIGQYVGEAWLSSDEHRPLLLHPAISRYGLAWDGIYWTLDVR
jgi:uncharacterized protein YkwD